MNQQISPRVDGADNVARDLKLASDRTNNFDFIRFLAAFFVIYGHCEALGGLPYTQLLGSPISVLGVMIFFSLSGYLVTDSWLRQPEPMAFFAKRSLRIFPALLVVVVTSAAVLGPAMTRLSIQDYVRNIHFWYYLRNVGLYISYNLPGVFDDNPYKFAVNGSLWSLPAEYLCYILVAAIGLTMGRLIGAGFIVGVIGLAAVNFFRFHYAGPQVVIYATDAFSAASVMIYFFVGAAFRCFRIPLHGGLAFLMACALVVATGRLPPEIFSVLLWLGLPYAVLGLGLQATPVLGRWGRFGDFSYGMYLYSFPISQTLIALSHNSINIGALIASVTALSIGCAFLSWHLVEKRALRLKPGRGSTYPRGDAVQTTGTSSGGMLEHISRQSLQNRYTDEMAEHLEQQAKVMGISPLS
jgi:peptidoglycan/LPS O-acetylase OafA/YrhL